MQLNTTNTWINTYLVSNPTSCYLQVKLNYTKLEITGQSGPARGRDDVTLRKHRTVSPVSIR